MRAHKDGGIASQKVMDLMRNWTLQSPLTSRNEEDEDDTELGGFKDIAEKLDAEFDRLQLNLSDPQDTDQRVRPLPGQKCPPLGDAPRGI